MTRTWSENQTFYWKTKPFIPTVEEESDTKKTKKTHVVYYVLKCMRVCDFDKMLSEINFHTSQHQHGFGCLLALRKMKIC